MGGPRINSNFLKRFKKCSAKNCKKYLNDASASEIISVCECALNVTNGNLPLSQKHLKKLRRHRKLLHEISFGKGNIRKKRALLSQKGRGLLTTLATVVLPLIGSLITK
jgi:hypothetical protein